jgi:4-alpha-glucanotransferase
MSAAHASRIAGVTIPLFSVRGSTSWGIGEIPDLVPLATWLKGGGLSLIQLLPLGEIAGNETSPYAALSAFGIDPMYVGIEALPSYSSDDLAASLGGGAALGELAALRQNPAVDYGAVRRLKELALRHAFDRFWEDEHARRTPLAVQYTIFCRTNDSWLADYALFRALKDAHEGAPWWQWYRPLREREHGALESARVTLAREAAFHSFVQWSAHAQWTKMRAELGALGVELMGDLPFMVARDSADVWAHRAEFRDGASVGVPPDAFNDEGQDWDLPPYDWRTMRANDFAWLRRRIDATAALYDRFRIDHLVGFYRTYSRERASKRDAGGKLRPGSFEPAEEAEQLAHGERVVAALVDTAASAGAQLIAEDLGAVPDFVRASLTKLGVPGYRVVMWERDGERFRDPASYPALSVACFGTHDTPPVAAWWEALTPTEREAACELPGLAELREAEEFTPLVHRALFDSLSRSGSSLVLFLVQDLFGERTRINTPATVSSHNWTYRIPLAIGELEADPAARARMAWIAESLRAGGRRLG